MPIRFAAGYDSADTLIEELILACSSPRSLTVVSSDHRIQRAAKKRRAEAIDSEVWYARMCKTKIDTTNTVADKPHAPQSSEEVQAWLQKFQADGTESGMTGKSEIEAIEKGLQGSGPFPPGYADDVIDAESDLRD